MDGMVLQYLSPSPKVAKIALKLTARQKSAPNDKNDRSSSATETPARPASEICWPGQATEFLFSDHASGARAPDCGGAGIRPLAQRGNRIPPRPGSQLGRDQGRHPQDVGRGKSDPVCRSDSGPAR